MAIDRALLEPMRGTRMKGALLFACCLACSSLLGASELRRIYDDKWAARLVPLLTETVRIETVARNAQAF